MASRFFGAFMPQPSSPLFFSKSSLPVQAELIFAADWAPIRDFAQPLKSRPESVYGDLLALLRSADLRLLNLEASLYGGSPAVKSGSVFHGEPEHVAALKAVPFEVVTLANNHGFDSGMAAFQKTCALLKKNGIAFLGAGANAEEAAQELQMQLKGLRLAIFNFCEAEDESGAGPNRPGVNGWNVQEVAQRIRSIRSKQDFIVVIAHCGLEYIPFPPPYVYEAFNLLAEAGADLVLGHHPHVPQGMQVRQGIPICYSQGNFVFYQETKLKFRKLGYLAKAGIGREGLHRLELIPYQIEPEQLRRLSPSEELEFADCFKQLSKPLQDSGEVNEAWQAFLAYHGQEGFQEELGRILQAWQTQPGKGAAMLRNRLLTPQHYWHWHDGLQRLLNPDAPEPKAEYLEMLRRFFQEEIKPKSSKGAWAPE